jgi:hypothetical protein
MSQSHVRVPRTDDELPCLGLEFDALRACRACLIRNECQRLCGARAGHVTLDKVVIKLTPEMLNVDVQLSDETPDESVIKCYQRVYRLVFQQRADNPLRIPDFAARARANAVACDCDVTLFFEVLMRAHASLQVERKFYANAVVGGGAQARVRAYRTACAQEFATFNVEAVADILGHDTQADRTRQRLEDGEVEVARWIIGYKSRAGGDAVEPCLDALEFRLSPEWLALEPLCHARLASTEGLLRSADDVAYSRARHRRNARAVLTRLRRDRDAARAAFTAREAAVKRALTRALQHHGLRMTDLRTSPVVTSPLRLYAKVGLAVQQILCRRQL